MSKKITFQYVTIDGVQYDIQRRNGKLWGVSRVEVKCGYKSWLPVTKKERALVIKAAKQLKAAAELPAPSRAQMWYELPRDGTDERDAMRAEMYAGLCIAENVCTDLPNGAPYLNVAAAIAFGKQCEAAQ